MTPRAAAARYARALFDVARKETDPEQAGRELTGFADLVASNDALSRALSNPAIPTSKKRAVVEQLLSRAGTIVPVVSKLLLLLAERDRMLLLPDLAAAYQDRLREHAKVVRAEVVTAVPLTAERLRALKDGLARATGREVQLESRVDPSIVGGAVTRIGSTVYDGSITTQLEKMKEQLTQAET